MIIRDEHGEVVGTKRFLSDMDQDQLLYCIEHANALLESKRNEARKTIWQVVEDRSLVIGSFREGDYLKAVDCLAQTAKREFESGDSNHYSIDHIRVPASEYESYFEDAAIDAHNSAREVGE